MNMHAISLNHIMSKDMKFLPKININKLES